jgi:hypothetical protein
MRVYYRASGGFGGLIREAEVNIKDLGLEEARVLRNLVAGARNAPTNIPHNAAARDAEEVEINIMAPDGSGKLSFDAREAPDEIKPLIAFMKLRSKPGGPG